MFWTLKNDLIVFNANHQPLTRSNVQGLADMRRDYYPTLKAHVCVMTS